MKQLNLLFLLLHFQLVVFAQQDGWDHKWIIGYNTNDTISGTLLTFTNDTLLAISPMLKPTFNTATFTMISNRWGEWQFYTNGCYVINKNLELMQNGDSIHSGIISGYCDNEFQYNSGPLIQSMLALPLPKSEHIYYLFGYDFEELYEEDSGFLGAAPEHLHYHTIDMTLDDGLGAVIAKKQIAVKDTLARCFLTASRKANCEGWWILVPKSHSNCYHTILLTENGIQDSFLQCSGHIYSDADQQGQAEFSPNGTKYVRNNFFNGLNIFDFDNETGLLSNPIHISYGLDTFYFGGVAFSPNSRFVYAMNYSEVHQFDMNAADVEASDVLIAELETPPNINFVTTFNSAKLAPDGKIYVVGAGTHNHLHVIHKPDSIGLACNLEQYGIPIPSWNVRTIPNFPHFRSWDGSAPCDTLIPTSTTGNFIFSESSCKVFPNPASELLEIVIELPSEFSPYHDGFFWRLYDVWGKELKDLKLNQQKSHFEISVANLPTGVYYYTLTNSSGVLYSGKTMVLPKP